MTIVAGSCLQTEVPGRGGEENPNRLKKQRAKQLKRIESVEVRSYTVAHQLLEEVRSNGMADVCVR